jgi:hypothetical protein
MKLGRHMPFLFMAFRLQSCKVQGMFHVQGCKDCRCTSLRCFCILVAAGNEKWKGMTWGMMPLLGGALSACTYHFFYNPPELDNLVVLQVTQNSYSHHRHIASGKVYTYILYNLYVLT